MKTENYEGKYVSTSVLARSIGIHRDELFDLLKSIEFIERANAKWELTEHGKNAGGIYKNHGNGLFIVWPLSILELSHFSNFKIQYHIAETNLYVDSIRQQKYNETVNIPVYPTVDIDFLEIKNKIDKQLSSFILQSIFLSKSEVTNFLTQVVANIGEKLGYQIEREPLYNITDIVDPNWKGARGDIVWTKNNNRMVMWEIDSTNKPNSIIKLMSSPAKYNIWLPWVKSVNRFRINCLLHAPTCQVIRPDQKNILELWSKMK